MRTVSFDKVCVEAGEQAICPKCRAPQVRFTQKIRMHERFSEALIEPLLPLVRYSGRIVTVCSRCFTAWMASGCVYLEKRGWVPRDPYQKAQLTEQEAELKKLPKIFY